MSERKWHAVAGSSSFKPGFGRFERRQAVVFVAALGAGMILFRLFSVSMGCPVWLSLTMASVVPALVGVFLACVVVGKPRHYAAHMRAWWWMRLIAWLAANGVPVAPKPLIEIEKNERK